MSKSNVLSIAASPKYNAPKNKPNTFPRPRSHKDGYEYVAFELSNAAFGFSESDLIVCNSKFDAKEIFPNTVVIAETEKGQFLTVAGTVKKSQVMAIAIQVIRDIPNTRC